jgi:hypothetical protein
LTGPFRPRRVCDDDRAKPRRLFGVMLSQNLVPGNVTRAALILRNRAIILANEGAGA